MGKTGVLGTFEELVLLALLHRRDEAYAVPIRRELSARTGTEVAMGAVYATLDRLQDKGLVGSRAEDDPSGPGRARRYYHLTDAGAAALAEGRRIREAMWRGVELPDAADGR